MYFGKNSEPIPFSNSNEDLTNEDIIDAFYKSQNFIFSVPSKRNSQKHQKRRRSTLDSNLTNINGVDDYFPIKSQIISNDSINKNEQEEQLQNQELK